jgi:hypothetical protein
MIEKLAKTFQKEMEKTDISKAIQTQNGVLCLKL